MAVLPVPEIVQKMAAQIDNLAERIDQMGKRLDQLADQVQVIAEDSHARAVKMDEVHASITVCKDMLRTLNRAQDRQ